MNEKKHNVIRFHWIRDMIFAGIVFSLCDMIIHNNPFTFRMFFQGIRFVFVLECILSTIYNELVDLTKESEGKNGI